MIIFIRIYMYVYTSMIVIYIELFYSYDQACLRLRNLPKVYSLLAHKCK